MKRRIIGMGILFSVLAVMGAAAAPAPQGQKAKVDDDKVKALADPYANDLGSDTVDIKGYPKNVQVGYKLLQDKCTKCHSASRPLNAQFVEVKKEELEKLKKSDADLFKDASMYKVEDGIWKRYVKRMAAKPGCELEAGKDQKAIWEFLVHDSMERKMGKQKDAWVKHRQGLLEEFKKKYPKRYHDLYAPEGEDQKDKP